VWVNWADGQKVVEAGPWAVGTVTPTSGWAVAVAAAAATLRVLVAVDWPKHGILGTSIQ
jgi:hypothetical protein